MQVDNVFCTCVFDDDYVSKRSDSPANIFRRAGGKPSSGGSRTSNTGSLAKTLEKGVSTAAKRGLDAAMMLDLLSLFSHMPSSLFICSFASPEQHL